MTKIASRRATRVADQIRMEVADIIMRKTRDPRVASVTVTDVRVTNDLQLARVYVTTRAEGAAVREALMGLEKASGFIRSELGRRLNLRYTPELAFFYDEAGSRGDRVLHLLENLSRNQAEASSGSGTQEEA
jgi:ribosome-binding factor A